MERWSWKTSDREHLEALRHLDEAQRSVFDQLDSRLSILDAKFDAVLQLAALSMAIFALLVDAFPSLDVVQKWPIGSFAIVALILIGILISVVAQYPRLWAYFAHLHHGGDPRRYVEALSDLTFERLRLMRISATAASLAFVALTIVAGYIAYDKIVAKPAQYHCYFEGGTAAASKTARHVAVTSLSRSDLIHMDLRCVGPEAIALPGARPHP